MSEPPRMQRRLGRNDAVVIGLGSMIGAGVFAAFGPAGFTSDARTTEGKAHRISYMASILDREITATADLTATDVARVTSALESDAHRAGVVLAGEDNGEQDGGADG